MKMLINYKIAIRTPIDTELGKQYLTQTVWSYENIKEIDFAKNQLILRNKNNEIIKIRLDEIEDFIILGEQQ